MNSTAAILMGMPERDSSPRPWFFVRASLLLSLAALLLVLTTMIIRPEVIDQVILAFL